ncbi:HECT and RLD domain containing E3 ubiquitin protein ligase family member 1 [Rhinolophus ferrumequinum]|uniref:HECT and RLD domain containing E3 ubiquitin protein ligase family member 1 n=1 Tax=Rhinolophus ferrumequinum TaxID=59479 RepID=A0A7J7XPC7_RHIFE|nr:HECT and RLD domain containing E3 ubiquitin protein ligase family member 1 [Rhinolophus ferrumequinum]
MLALELEVGVFTSKLGAMPRCWEWSKRAARLPRSNGMKQKLQSASQLFGRLVILHCITWNPVNHCLLTWRDSGA